MREKQLLPVRHPQGELFLCDLGDVPLKDDAATMEHPIFALSTKPDRTERHYEHAGNSVTISPSVRGLATIYDKDILIFAISQIMEAKNNGLPYSKEVAFNAYDFLRFANRMTNGQAYQGLKDSLVRLQGTVIQTDIVTGGIEQTDTFGLVDKSRVRRKLRDGTVTDWSITLSDWLFNAIEANEVLTLHPDYFRLRKPLERRIYEIVRKHCGNQREWKVGVDLLLKKTGSQTSMKKFRQLLAPIMEADHLPDYSAAYVGEKEEFILFKKRVQPKEKIIGTRVVLDSETYAKARQVAPGWDIHMLEDEWRMWMHDKGKERPDNPDKAFIGFCRSWFKRKGRP
jgi:plasmid replication initiation protein